ncbi:tetratricopeptide repeat protein [Pendulispora albinea]|uniref:Tetratricopeptide repeat protein n=1 Tax=Pendulispora albinea TaxID=2741071 RepID=A0ABZ2LJ59_9BACT
MAAGSEENARTAQAEIQQADREVPSVNASVLNARTQLLSAEQRLANGEILYRMKDYDRASVVLGEIIEGYPNTPSYPDAMWLRGETYYASQQYLSARRDYRQLVDRGGEPRFQPYFGKALARLVDVSVRLGDVASLDSVYQRLQQVPPAQVDAGIQYARGKASYFRKDYTTSAQHFGAVAAGTPYTHQARYFAGLVAIKQARPNPASAASGSSGQAIGKPIPVEGTSTTGGPEPRPTPLNYKPAIEAFRQVTVLPADTPEHQHVIDLAWMAIGRLFYEMDQFNQASEAYSRVGRESPEFDTMLYELAWVYVRLGDVQRAERALEVLSIADPDSSYAGDGTLLRADLLLRAGAFDKALQLYLGVREQYDPMRVKVENFLESTKDPAVYYEKLSQQQLDVLDVNEQLPPIAIRWAREAEDGPAAFRVIDDINQCKKLIAESERLIDKLITVSGSANRVRAFPELLAGEQRALGLINKVARARVRLARGLDDEEPGDLSGEIGSIRSQRRQLMGVVEQTPVTQQDFDDRDYDGSRQWNTVSQELSRRVKEVDYLHAVVNGLRRMIKEDAQRGVARDPASVQRIQAELDDNERTLKLYQDQATELRRQIEIGRAQVGLGDARYQNDAQARQQFRELVEREVQLASSGQAGSNAQAYAQRISPILSQARSTEERVTAAFNQLEAQVAQRVAELRGKIDAEGQKIAGYKVQLQALDGDAHDLVGHVAQRNFTLVRDKIRNIVLRADVGITEQAWEVREEELERVRNLQHERAREEQLLDEELREVLDDAGEAAPAPATSPK